MFGALPLFELLMFFVGYDVERDTDGTEDGDGEGHVERGRWRYRDKELYSRMKDRYFCINRRCRIQKLNILDFADYIFSLGRIACWVIRCAIRQCAL